jgi:titin
MIKKRYLRFRLIPVGDPTLKVEWFKDGQIISSSSRINYINDFGCVTLDLSDLRSSDEGIYECKATNSLGEAVTTASVKIGAKGSLILDSHHPEGMKKINALEMGKMKRQVSEGGKDFEKPVFTHPLNGTSAVAEGQNAHMECRVVPVGDPSLKFEWFCNGKQLKMGSRFQVTQDFGFVTLDIASCVAEDSGMYIVKAKNLAGESNSSFALHVGDGSSVMKDALHPDSMKKIHALEAQKGKRKDLGDDAVVNQPPVFMESLKDIGTVNEGQNIHVEATIEPKNDPSLKVEWELNGKSVSSGSRLKTSLDFGHVQLFIQGVRASDSGLYTCKAMNKLGEAVSTTSIKVEGRKH